MPMVNARPQGGRKNSLTGIGWDLHCRTLGYDMACDYDRTTVGWNITRDAIGYGGLKPEGFVPTIYSIIMLSGK
jgi:hypothetical protein